MARIVWKGAIVFGLVHIPISLKAAAHSEDLDFDWLDRRDMSPVGYSRINKSTGKVIDREFIVKGYEYSKGEYVILSDEDFKRAKPEATQTVEILSFVKTEDIPVYFFETPYFLEPDRRAEKGYALLREALRKSGRSGLARVVLHARQHLAALLVEGDVLMLNTMRFANEILPATDVKVPSQKETKPTARELAMAERLVTDMSEPWKPERYADDYRDSLLAVIDQRIHGGKTELLNEPGQPQTARKSAQVIDLVALLKESINSHSKPRTTKPTLVKRASVPRKAAAAKTRRAGTTATKAVSRTPPARKRA